MGYFQMTRNVEEIFGGVVVAPHQIPFTYTSTNGGETFISLPFYPITGFVTINSGVQVPIDNFEIDGNTLNLGRELEPGDVVFCLFDKIMSPQDASNHAILIYKFLSIGGETEFTPDFTAYGVQSLYVDGKYQVPGEDYNYYKTTGKVIFDNPLPTNVWVVAEMNIKQNVPALAGNNGASQIGTETGKTVQEELDYIDKHIEETKIKAADPDYIINPPVASIKFGDDDKNAQLDVDVRGKLSVSVHTNGMPMAERVHIPYSETTGFYKGPFPDTIVKFPTSDEPDDFKSHGVLLSYDTKRSRPRFFLLPPYSTSQHGFVTPVRTWGNPLLPEMADINSIGKSLSNSYDQYFTLDSNNKNYFKLASISNGANLPGAFLSCILNIGNYTTKKRAVYSLNVQTPDYSAALNVNSIMDMVKLICIDGSNGLTSVAASTTPTVDSLVVGLVKTATGFDVWLSLPAHSTYFSCNVINSGSEDLITFDWSILKSNLGLSSLAGIPAAGTVWAPVDVVLDSRRTVPLNDGSLFNVPVGYMMLRLHANGTTVALDPRFQWISSFCRRSVVDSATSTVSTVNCSISSHVFTVTGCDLATSQPVYITKPKSLTNQGDLRVQITNIDTTNHSFKVTVVERTLNAVTTATTNAGVTTYSTVLNEVLTPIDPPADTWVDVLVKLV